MGELRSASRILEAWGGGGCGGGGGVGWMS
jgi:hypothetical protein